VHLTNHVRQVDGFQVQEQTPCRNPRHVEKLPDEAFESIALPGDPLEAPLHPFSRRMSLGQIRDMVEQRIHLKLQGRERRPELVGSNREELLAHSHRLRELHHESFTFGLRSLPARDFSDVSGEDGRLLALDHRDRQLHGKLRAVGMKGRHLDDLAQDGSFSSREQPGDASSMLFAETWRDQEFGHFLSQELLCRVAEHPLRGRVEVDDQPSVVERDDPVER
jgi:hypothetical protein